ncbi:MAG: tetratricopeptide repeat protein [Phycisphaerae bacterium]|nr:tetratricopeptide repeat protein [Phycisphaerae bacterium]
MRTTPSRFTRSLAHALVGATLALACGCGTTGSHTSRSASHAKQTLQAIKSATEWDMARQAFLAGDLEKALKAADRSIALNDAVPKSHVLRGRILLEMSDLEGAIAAFEQAEALDPDHVDAFYYQGVVHERLAAKERALDRYAKAAELDPAAPQYAIAAAEMLIDLARVAEARGFLDARQATFEHNAGVRHLMGQIAMMESDPVSAERLFNEARLLSPDDSAIVEDLIRAQMANGKFADAEFQIARLLKQEQNAGRRDLLKLQARCMVQIDRLVDAREILSKLTRGAEGTSDADAWVELANVSYALKDDVRARQAAARAIAIAPRRGEGYLVRALVERRSGNLDLAVATLTKGAGSSPQDARILTMLAIVESERQNPAQARAALDAVLRIDPDNAAAKNLLSTVRESP